MHTPGPWIYDAGSFIAECQLGEDGYMKPGERPIAEMVGGREEDWEANANLIKAAPELLETLTELYEFAERIHGETILGKPIRVKAKRLITRLKGES